MTLPILYDARLVEQVVLQAARQLAPESAREFHLERERAYEIADQQERETAFRGVFSRWFHALDLGRALSLALAEAPTLARQTRVCRVEEAARARDEGADLYDLARAALPDADLTPCDEGPAPPRIVFIRLRSQLFLDQSALLDLLRRELVHVTDMLDPSFGYERDLPPAEAGPSHDALLRARYRVLWNVTVDGRLQRRNLAAQGARDRRHREFCETFAMLGDRARPEFERWWQMTCPTHACLLAEEIIIPRIIVPPSPGTICALGAAIADVKNDYIKSLRGDLSKTSAEAIRNGFAELESAGRAWLAGENPVIDEVVIRRSVDARYYGQAFDIEVEVPGAAEALAPERIGERFHDTYEALYRNSDRTARIDLVNLRVRITGKTPPLALRPVPRATGEPASKAVREIWYGGKRHLARLYERSQLAAGHRVEGPAVIEQFDTTTVVAPGFVAVTDEHGVLNLTRRS